MTYWYASHKELIQYKTLKETMTCKRKRRRVCL